MHMCMFVHTYADTYVRIRIYNYIYVATYKYMYARSNRCFK